MKQTTKRFYGALVGVAFLSGLTGAFAYSLSQKSVDKVLPSFSFTEPKKAQEPASGMMHLSTASAPAAQPVDLTEAAEKACNAVVYIKVVQKGRQQTIEYRDPFEDFFGDFFGRGGGGTQRRQVETPKREAAGSGVIISDDGYIVTNNHVVENADDITITLNDNREFTAKVIGTDADTDLALLKINSGGALVNTRGELVGINAMLYSQTGSFTGYGFAIPTTIMKKVVTDLQAYGTVQRAMIGISGMTLHDYIDSKKRDDEKFEADFGTVDGVYVAEVVDDGAAAEAGLKSGDVIVSVDGKKVTKMSELQEATTKYRPGDKAQIGYIRDKKEKTATITFRNAKGSTNVVKAQKVDALGAEFKALTESQQKTLHLSYGVQVTNLKSGYLKDAGVPEGFIILKANNQNIKSAADMESVFKSAQTSDEQTLWIWGKTPAGRSMSFAVYLGE